MQYFHSMFLGGTLPFLCASTETCHHTGNNVTLLHLASCYRRLKVMQWIVIVDNDPVLSTHLVSQDWDFPRVNIIFKRISLFKSGFIRFWFSMAVFTLEDEQIVRTDKSSKKNKSPCKRDQQTFRWTNRLIFGRLEGRFYPDDLPVETNKSTIVRHKFASYEQMPDDLLVLKCENGQCKMHSLHVSIHSTIYWPEVDKGELTAVAS